MLCNLCTTCALEVVVKDFYKLLCLIELLKCSQLILINLLAAVQKNILGKIAANSTSLLLLVLVVTPLLKI